MLANIRTSIIFILLMMVIAGFFYPVTVSLVGQVFFKEQADGSLIIKDNQVVGSKLIGQEFKKRGYFYSRPSYAGNGYDPLNSRGSNYAISNNELVFSINQLANQYIVNSANRRRQVPVDMVTSSSSGLDPHISAASAYYQVSRVARERKIPAEKVQQLVEKNMEKAWLGIFGQDKVNILLLNMKLDELTGNK